MLRENSINLIFTSKEISIQNQLVSVFISLANGGKGFLISLLFVFLLQLRGVRDFIVKIIHLAIYLNCVKFIQLSSDDYTDSLISFGSL